MTSRIRGTYGPGSKGLQTPTPDTLFLSVPRSVRVQKEEDSSFGPRTETSSEPSVFTDESIVDFSQNR